MTRNDRVWITRGDVLDFFHDCGLVVAEADHDSWISEAGVILANPATRKASLLHWSDISTLDAVFAKACEAGAAVERAEELIEALRSRERQNARGE